MVSELRRPRPHGAVLDWTEDVPAEQLFVSAVTVGGIQAGTEITREQDEAKAEELESWLDKALASYGVLPMDALAFREWARLMHRKSDTMTEDATIAATATVHRLIVLTRNASDYGQPGVELQNPFCKRVVMIIEQIEPIRPGAPIIKGRTVSVPRVPGRGDQPANRTNEHRQQRRMTIPGGPSLIEVTYS